MQKTNLLFNRKKIDILLKFFRKTLKYIGRSIIRFFYPELVILDQTRPECGVIPNTIINSQVSIKARLYPPYHIKDSSIGDYCGIARNSWISMTKIGKFCSIGPNFCSGWGIHPTNGISTSPMFYSTLKQNGYTLCNTNKIQERKPITIGNDVYIGMNVIILDGVAIGDGAVIGAGCVVRSDVPPYATAVGNPMRLLPRFPKEIAEKLENIAWWNWPQDKLQEVEKYFFDVEKFCEIYSDEFTNKNIAIINENEKTDK